MDLFAHFDKDQLPAILNAMQDCVCIVDREGRIRYINPAMVEHFGPLRGRECREYLCEEGQPCQWCRPERGKEVLTNRYEWSCPRNRRTYDVVDTPFRDGEGNAMLLKILHDISAHKEAAEAIRASQKDLERQVLQRTADLERTVDSLRLEVTEHLETQEKLHRQQALLMEQTQEQRKLAKLLELANDSVLIHDMEGRITFWNRGAERTFGWTQEEAIGQISHELLRTQFREPAMRITAQLVSHGAWEGELIHRARDGREVVVESRWALHTDDSGRPTAILEIDRDITDRKTQEQEIQQHENQLQALSEQLLIAEEHYRKHMSTVLHDSIGQLLSFSKRELSSIEKEIPEGLRERFRRALSEIDAAIQQSRDLTMEMSSPTLYAFGFEAAVEELGEILAAREGFEFHFRSDETSKELPEDVQILLYRSVRELLTNAIRHSRGSTIRVEIGRTDDRIGVRVEDDGRGFDVSVIDRYPRDQKKFGLFGIRERLTYIGGDFTIESEKNRGTRVTLSVPTHKRKSK